MSALEYAKSRVRAEKTNPLLVAVSDAKKEACEKLRVVDMELVSLVESKLVK
jgi:hypothetical protein